jgi:hypothetical protein
VAAVNLNPSSPQSRKRRLEAVEESEKFQRILDKFAIMETKMDGITDKVESISKQVQLLEKRPSSIKIRLQRRKQTFASLPPEILFRIFSYLKPVELGRCGRVNHSWGRASNDPCLWKKLQSEIAFGKDKWNEYYGDVGEEPAFPRRLFKIFNTPTYIVEKDTLIGEDFPKGKNLRQFFKMIVLIPKTVNGKALTFKCLGEVMQNPKKGLKISYKDFTCQLLEKFGNTPIQDSYWALVTEVLPGSIGKSYEIQQKLIEGYAIETKVDYKVPEALPLATALVARFMSTGDRCRSLIACQETIRTASGDSGLVVGELSGGTLKVTDYPRDYFKVAIAALAKF